MQSLTLKHLFAAVMLLFSLPALAVDVNFNVPVNVTDYPGKSGLSVNCTAGPQTTGFKFGETKIPLVNGSFYGNVKVTVKDLEPKDVQNGQTYVCRFPGSGEFGTIVIGGQLDNSKKLTVETYGKF